LLGPYTDAKANKIAPTNIGTIISKAAAPGGPLTAAGLTTGEEAMFTGSVSAGVQWKGKNYLAGVAGAATHASPCGERPRRHGTQRRGRRGAPQHRLRVLAPLMVVATGLARSIALAENAHAAPHALHAVMVYNYHAAWTKDHHAAVGEYDLIVGNH
jgi:hypothetical protein